MGKYHIYNVCGTWNQKFGLMSVSYFGDFNHTGLVQNMDHHTSYTKYGTVSLVNGDDKENRTISQEMNYN